MNIDPEKDNLIEMLGIHLEKQHTLPPLAGRIWATIIVEGKETGLTFEYLLERLKVSKSSISTNLNLLLKTDKIYYTTHSGERRKYFWPHPFSERFNRFLRSIDFEKKIIEKMIHYESKRNKETPNNHTHNLSIYKEHLSDLERLILRMLQNLRKIEETTNQH